MKSQYCILLLKYLFWKLNKWTKISSVQTPSSTKLFSLKVKSPIINQLHRNITIIIIFIRVCGVSELYKYKQELNGKTATPGVDRGIPVYDIMEIYPKNEAKRKDMELKELKNGRLAMLGIAGFAIEHYLPGSVPLTPL